MSGSRRSYLSCNQSTDSSFTQEKSTGISKDLEKLSISPEIKLDANNLYLKMKLGQKRTVKRKMAVVFCIYQVILNTGEYYDVVHLGKEFKLDETQSNAAISMYTKELGQAGLTGQNHKGNIDPEAMLRYYCGPKALALEVDQLEEIEQLYRDVKDVFVNFECSKKVFVSGLIYLWMRRKALSFDQNRFLEVFPGVTFKKLHQIYVVLYNIIVLDKEEEL